MPFHDEPEWETGWFEELFGQPSWGQPPSEAEAAPESLIGTMSQVPEGLRNLIPEWLYKSLLAPMKGGGFKEKGEMLDYDVSGVQMPGDWGMVHMPSEAQSTYSNLREQGYNPQSFSQFSGSLDLNVHSKQAVRNQYTQYLDKVASGELGMPEEAYQGGIGLFQPGEYGKMVAGGQGRTPSSAGFTEWKPEMFRELKTGFYEPEIAKKRSTLAERLIGRTEQARGLGGDIAGYGGRQRAVGQERAGFTKGVEDIYADVGQKQTAALQNIYDVIDQYTGQYTG